MVPVTAAETAPAAYTTAAPAVSVAFVPSKFNILVQIIRRIIESQFWYIQFGQDVRLWNGGSSRW
jgi:hypothetical protein